MILPLILAALNVSGPTDSVPTDGSARCRVQQIVESPDGRWPVAEIERFVRDADVILLAVAVGVEGDARAGASESRVRFRTTEVLAGEGLWGDHGARDLAFPGILAEGPDFNPGSIPYQIVRSSGQRGECHAMEYRIDGQYLFLLRENQGILTPYWAPLAPTNEEVRGEEDPWVSWVRDRIRSRPSDPSSRIR
jgi:hypothetical protein